MPEGVLTFSNKECLQVLRPSGSPGRWEPVPPAPYRAVPSTAPWSMILPQVFLFLKRKKYPWIVGACICGVCDCLSNSASLPVVYEPAAGTFGFSQNTRPGILEHVSCGFCRFLSIPESGNSLLFALFAAILIKFRLPRTAT